jgi:hypothetical protein
MAGLLHYRKGTEFAVRAFLDQFDESDVRLVLRTRGVPGRRRRAPLGQPDQGHRP